MSRVIGIAGPARSGKDTAADYLIEQHPQYHKASFADPIKDMLRVGLGLTDEQLYGDQKEIVDERYGCSPRHIMQTLGTEWGRTYICDDLWVRTMRARIELAPVIIPDIRFENEAAFVREHGVLLHVTGRARTIDSGHQSEWLIEPVGDDIIVTNDSTLEAFHKQLEVLKCYFNS